MPDDIYVELVEEKIENHELSHAHSDHSECASQIAELRARIAELESGHHVHDDEFEEVGEPVIEEV